MHSDGRRRRRRGKPSPLTGPNWERYNRDFRQEILPSLLHSGLMVSIGETVAPEHIDLRAATELGLMLLLGKPLLLIVPPGETVPDALRRAAAVVLEDLDIDSPEGQARLSDTIAGLTGEADPS